MGRSTGVRKAKHWEGLPDGWVRCGLCPHRCRIPEGKRGVCGVRENRGGELYTLIYGKVSSVAVDPIEKKPLYHFHPGSYVLSFGGVGCNFRCVFCQNWEISQSCLEDSFLTDVDPERVSGMIAGHHADGAAWTYNEPTIWHEYTLDSMRHVKKAGYYTVYVTNGYIEEDPLRELAPFLDAMNVDVKSIREEYYRKLCKARLQPVLDSCVLAKNLGIHLEITYLIVPTENDSRDDFRDFTSWVVSELGVDTPVHFSRFHPDYKLTHLPVTPMETLRLAYRIAKDAGLKFVYLGNVPHSDEENTYCPDCGVLVIERWGFNARLVRVDSRGRCGECGANLNLVV